MTPGTSEVLATIGLVAIAAAVAGFFYWVLVILKNVNPESKHMQCFWRLENAKLQITSIELAISEAKRFEAKGDMDAARWATIATGAMFNIVFLHLDAAREMKVKEQEKDVAAIDRQAKALAVREGYLDEELAGIDSPHGVPA